jgi:hypothetical protein
MRRTVVGALVACVLGSGLVYADGPRTYQTANLNTAPGDPPPGRPTAGAATLYRSKNSLEMRVASGDLTTDSSYTVWWVVFNNPAACTPNPGCGMDDLARPEVRASVFYAAGFVTGSATAGNVDAHIDAGALPAGIDIEVGTGLDPGNGFGAEVHIVVRTHGTTVPGIVDRQSGTFNEGCAPTCRNVRVAVFMPVD